MLIHQNWVGAHQQDVALGTGQHTDHVLVANGVHSGHLNVKAASPSAQGGGAEKIKK